MPSGQRGGGNLYVVPGSSDATDCDHDAVTALASDGGSNRYFSCERCGSVLVEDRLLQPSQPAHDLGPVDPDIEDLLRDIEHYHRRTGSKLGDSSRTILDRIATAWWRLLG